VSSGYSLTVILLHQGINRSEIADIVLQITLQLSLLHDGTLQFTDK